MASVDAGSAPLVRAGGEVDEVSEPPRRRRRRSKIVAFVVAAATLVAGGMWFFTSAGFAGTGQERADSEPPATEVVVLGTLEGSTTAVGTLGYSDPRSIRSATAGTVTSLPAPGSVITLGDALYSIDNVPVFVLRGSLPAWRAFTTGMDDGPDVKQLEESLRDLGYFSGEPDDSFTWATVEAIMSFQDSRGLDDTGELPLGSIVFAGGDLRIGSVGAAVGDQVGAGGELLEATNTSQIVEVNLKLADQQLAVLEAPVVVRLPGGTKTTGKITSVGTPTEIDDASGQKQTVIPVVVALDDPAAAAAFQEAAVSVDIPSERREDVLSVPVGALIAISAEQFGVEIVLDDGTTRQLPVSTGLFAGGRVEISGDEVKAGMRVVVPRR